jgi:peptidoglycan hydrolase-like protein with peptidoglycan-binding domain
MRAGARTGRGKTKPKPDVLRGPDGKPISADTDFNKLHPRQRGGPGGGRFIQKGDGQDDEHGDDQVAQAQARLAQLGHPLVADGKFGPKTEGAVKEFQKKYGLPSTGKIDLATAEMMRNPPPQDLAQVAAAEKAATATKGGKGKSAKGKGKGGASKAGGASGGSSGVLKLGTGTPQQPNQQVQQAQQQLQDLGFDVGTDGVFGKDTQRAIQRLQMMTGLKVDGILGPATMQMLLLQAQRLQKEDQELYGTSPNGKGGSTHKTRRARTLQHAQMDEASFQNGIAQPYGGAVMVAIPVVPGDFPDPADETDTRVRPPNLREAANGSWEACLNCVHFNTKYRCLLHAYPVDTDDVCDNHLSLTPQEQRHWGGYMEAFRDVVEARAAGDGSALARAEARRDYHVSKLEEIGTRQKERVMNEAKRPGSKSQDDRAKRSVGGSAGRTGGDSNGHRHAVNLLRGKRQDPRDGAKQITEVKSSAYPGLDRSPKKNWVDKAGGLPKYIERIAKHLHYEKGMDIGHAIAVAVNVVKKMCAAGDTNFPGKQNVNAGSRAEACAAVKQWESKKLRHGVMREAASKLEREPIPKSTVGLGFAVRTVREVQEIDRAIAEGSYTPEF